MRLHMTLGKRIASGIVLMLVLMLAVGAAGYFGLAQVLRVAEFYKDINELETAVSSVKGHMDRYLLAMAKGQKEGEEKMIKEVRSLIQGVMKRVDALQSRWAMDQHVNETLALIDKGLKAYGKVMEEYFAFEKSRESTEAQIENLYRPFINTAGKGQLMHEEMNAQSSQMKGFVENLAVLVSGSGKQRA